MYHGTSRERGDKKRQRLVPPPNEVWMEAIMNKGKTPDSYIPASTITSSQVTNATLSSTMAWQERATPQVSMGLTQYPSSEYQDKVAERSTPYQGRKLDSSTGLAQGGLMDAVAAYQGRSMTAPGIAGSSARADGAVKYQGRALNSLTAYQKRIIEGRMMDEAARAMGGAAAFQGETTDAAGYQGKFTQSQQSRAMESCGGELEQDGKVEGSTGTMVEDYKRDRKLPPRVEEMLREQLNLDETVLYDAFAVAMEDLILEQEANFVAKGLCHLCGIEGKQYVPVVNFCPHADENHSLCREHLRSAHRVRMEALFVGRNGSTPNRRLLRCLACTRECPCALCKEEKKQDVHKYKCYLLETLRRSGQGLVSGGGNDSAAAGVYAQAFEERLTHSQSIQSNGGRQYTQCSPTPQVDNRLSVQHDGSSAWTSKTEATHEGRKPVQLQQPDRKQYVFGGRNNHNDYGLNAPFSSMQATGIPTSSKQTTGIPTSSMQVSSMQTLKSQVSEMPTSSIQASSVQTCSMQAQQKHASLCPPVPTQAAKNTRADDLSLVTNGASVADPRVAARVASPHVHQGSMESASAVTVLNCAESEKSLVELLSSLNQSGAPPSSTATSAGRQFSKDSQSEARYATNGVATRKGPNGNAQCSSGMDTEASPRMYPGRRIADKRRQGKSSFEDQLSTMDSGDSPPRGRSSGGARIINLSQVLKRKPNESETSQSLEPRYLNTMTSRDILWAPNGDENGGSEHRNEGQRHHQSEAKVTSKADGCYKEHTDVKANSSSQTPPPRPPPHRGPGRPRKASGSVAAAPALPSSRGGRKGLQERKATTSSKKRGGRPSKRAKQAQSDDEDTEDEEDEEDEEMEVEDDEEEDGSESELDANLDYCEVCQGAGDLVCCDKCPRSFHLNCLHMTEDDLPEGDWQCNECTKPSRFDAYSVAVASEKTLLAKCLRIVECLKSHPFSKQFLSPVENVPMYTRVVKQPMDLSKIENKLKKGAYAVDNNTVAGGVKELDSTHFANDVRLMWSNCKLFNDDGSGITRAADILSAGFERLYKESIAPPLAS